MEFVNDPKVEDLPVVGGSAVTLVALRTRCGPAFRWEPGGDLAELVAFVGDRLVLVGGDLYERNGEHLSRYDVRRLAKPLVFVRPPAGDVFDLDPADFTRMYARVDVPLSEFDAMSDEVREDLLELAELRGRVADLGADLAAAQADLAEALEMNDALRADIPATRVEVPAVDGVPLVSSGVTVAAAEKAAGGGDAGAGDAGGSAPAPAAADVKGSAER